MKPLMLGKGSCWVSKDYKDTNRRTRTTGVGGKAKENGDSVEGRGSVCAETRNHMHI